MADRILVAFAGKPDGSIELVDNRQPPGHTNKMLRQAGDHSPIEWTVGDIVFTRGQWDDALKVSGCHNLTVYAGYVQGGTEDVLDVNHSNNCTVFIEEAYPRGKFVSTQKGASKNITVQIDRQHGHGTEVDHDYGNHSDQGNGYTTDCSLNVKMDDGGEATVRVLRGTMPSLLGGRFKVVFPKPDAWYHKICIWFLNLVQ